MKIRNILAIIALILLGIAAIVENTVKISLPEPVFYIKNIVLVALFIYLLVILFMIIVNKCVPSESKPKFKYEHLKVSYGDILFWLEKADVPDTLYLKGTAAKFIKLEVQFATIGKNGPFVNKEIFLNDKELPLDIIDNELKKVLFLEENSCVVLGYTENNDPKLFLNVLNDLKK